MLVGKNVLILTDDDIGGGTASVTRFLANGLSTDYQVSIGYNRNPISDRFFSKVTGVNYANTGVFIKEFWRSACDDLSAQKLIRQRKWDLVIFSDCMALGSQVALKRQAYNAGIPYIVIANSVPPNSLEFLGPLSGMAIEVLNNANAIVFVSNFDSALFSRICPDVSCKRLVISNTCDLKFFQNVVSDSTRESHRKELGIEPDEIVLFTAGRLEYLKGQHLVINALSAYHAKKRTGISRFRYLVAGKQDPDYKQKLIDLIDRAGLSAVVQLLGYREDIAELLLASDLHVLLSFHEGSPISVIEASAMGRPTIASSVNGISEQIDNSCGWLVPDPNSAAVQCVEGMSLVLSEISSSPEVLCAKGQGARVIANSRFHPSIVLGRYKSLLREEISIGSKNSGGAVPKLHYELDVGDSIRPAYPFEIWNYLGKGWSPSFGVRPSAVKSSAEIKLPIKKGEEPRNVYLDFVLEGGNDLGVIVGLFVGAQQISECRRSHDGGCRFSFRVSSLRHDIEMIIEVKVELERPYSDDTRWNGGESFNPELRLCQISIS